ncbi:MAG: hypothetical protein AAB573_00170 [Patescibacteria group bacterium]
MNNSQIIGVVVVALIVIGGGYYLMTGGTVGDSMMTQDEAEGKMMSGAFTGSWKELALRGGNYVCDINQSAMNTDTTGTIYVMGNKLRGEFMTQSATGIDTSYMLKDADTIYIWSSAMPQGIIMKASAIEGSGAESTSAQIENQNLAYDWSCRATGSDSALFMKPADVEFVDMELMMQGSMQGQIPPGMMGN